MTKIHDIDTAPDASKPLLENSQQSFGMIPNLHGVMATSPALLEGYQQLHRLAVEATAFDATERTVVWQTVNVENGCHYCVPAHTGIAKNDGVDDAVTEALRQNTALPDDKLEALRSFTQATYRSHGRPGADAITAFRDAGYGDQAIMDVILIVAQKVMSNFTNAIFETPVDKPFQKFAWNKDEADAA